MTGRLKKKVLSYLAECKVSKSNYRRNSNNVHLAPRKPNIIARNRELNCYCSHFQESNGRLCATFKIGNCVSSAGCPLGARLTKLVSQWLSSAGSVEGQDHTACVRREL